MYPSGNLRIHHETQLGQVILGDALSTLENVRDKSVDLVITSPPFGLVRKKEYGNVSASEYVDWFRPFGAQFKRVLKDTGSLVIDIGGSWNSGTPTRHLYHFKLLIMLCEELELHLAQELYWWNPSKLPTPAEWVTVRRIRVKDAVNCLWWLSPSPWPKASNRRVLQPYSDAMEHLLKNGYKAKKRPSGHDISNKFICNNGAAIPPNLLAIPNTESNSAYLRYCSQKGIKPHPARYPAELPEYFVRMLTDPGDLVIDPFAGSCVTGEVCERLGRRWICCEIVEEYLEGALGRFRVAASTPKKVTSGEDNAHDERNYYRLPRPGLLWESGSETSLSMDGGSKGSKRSRAVTSDSATRKKGNRAVGRTHNERQRITCRD